ncbi:MAG: hypothetical protein KDD22_06365 [Bdellovibrionales bacterium]|nr:hypothetical protein [Bdellovibrionales bacterium]
MKYVVTLSIFILIGCASLSNKRSGASRELAGYSPDPFQNEKYEHYNLFKTRNDFNNWVATRPEDKTSDSHFLNFYTPLEENNFPSSNHWIEGGFSELEYYQIKSNFGINIVSIPMNVYVQKRAIWSLDEVEKRLKKAQEYYYKNCGITLSPINIIYGYRKDFSGLGNRFRIFPQASFNPDPNFPFVIFTDYLNRKSGSFGMTGHAYSEDLDWNIFFKNTIFIYASTLYYENREDPSYDVLIHELAHTLVDRDHNSISGNVLSEMYDGLHINKEQCEAIKTNFRQQ